MEKIEIKDKVANFDGILAVGDVHGNIAAARNAIQFAGENNLFIVFLGDIIDYGHQNFAVTKAVFDLVKDGKAEMIIGNHDVKFWKFLKQRSEGEILVKIKGGIVSTVNEFEMLPVDKKREWENMFNELIDVSSYHKVLDNVMFVHAGATPEMWTDEVLNGKSRSRAIFGELNKNQPFDLETGYPNRVYNWIDNLEPVADNVGRFVFFGHDILSMTEPTINTNEHGCAGVSVDTGSSKGGILSGVVVEMRDGFWFPGATWAF